MCLGEMGSVGQGSLKVCPNVNDRWVSYQPGDFSVADLPHAQDFTTKIHQMSRQRI